MFEKLTLNDKVFNVQKIHLSPRGLENTADNDVRSIQSPSLAGRAGVGLLIIHCSATLPDQRVSVQDIDR